MAWYSDEDGEAFHICENCPASQQIEPENRQPGTNELPLCKHCAVLSKLNNCN